MSAPPIHSEEEEDLCHGAGCSPIHSEEEEDYYKMCHGAGCSVVKYHPYRSFFFCSKKCEENPGW